MSDAPQDARYSEFADYVLENYIEDGATFPPVLWSEEPSDSHAKHLYYIYKMIIFHSNDVSSSKLVSDRLYTF
jgi:hypothetical protein